MMAGLVASPAPAQERGYTIQKPGGNDFSREMLEDIKREAIREFYFSPKRVRLAMEVLPNFYTQRDIDAALLATIISGEISESDILDPFVRETLHRYFLIADRFSQHAGFYV